MGIAPAASPPLCHLTGLLCACLALSQGGISPAQSPLLTRKLHLGHAAVSAGVTLICHFKREQSCIIIVLQYYIISAIILEAILAYSGVGELWRSPKGASFSLAS